MLMCKYCRRLLARDDDGDWLVTYDGNRSCSARDNDRTTDGFALPHGLEDA